jgi:hypothetical protein
VSTRYDLIEESNDQTTKAAQTLVSISGQILFDRGSIATHEINRNTQVKSDSAKYSTTKRKYRIRLRFTTMDLDSIMISRVRVRPQNAAPTAEAWIILSSSRLYQSPCFVRIKCSQVVFDTKTQNAHNAGEYFSKSRAHGIWVSSPCTFADIPRAWILLS